MPILDEAFSISLTMIIKVTISRLKKWTVSLKLLPTRAVYLVCL